MKRTNAIIFSLVWLTLYFGTIIYIMFLEDIKVFLSFAMGVFFWWGMGGSVSNATKFKEKTK